MPHVHSTAARARRRIRAIAKGFVPYINSYTVTDNAEKRRGTPIPLDNQCRDLPPCPPPLSPPPGIELRCESQPFVPCTEVQSQRDKLLSSAMELIDKQNQTIACLIQSTQPHCDIEVVIKQRLDSEKKLWKEEVQSMVEKIKLTMRETLDAKDAEIQKLREEVDKMAGQEIERQPRVDETTQPSVGKTLQPRVDATPLPRVVVCSMQQQSMKRYSFQRSENMQFMYINKLRPQLPTKWNEGFPRDMPVVARCIECFQSMNPEGDAWMCKRCDGLLHAENGWTCTENHRCSHARSD